MESRCQSFAMRGFSRLYVHGSGCSSLQENLDTLGDEISRLNEELTAYKRRR